MAEGRPIASGGKDRKVSKKKALAPARAGISGGVKARGGVSALLKRQAELLAEQRVAGLQINLNSMALVSNIHRASAALRDHFERALLTPVDLHWSAFVTLWCLWIYGEMETRHLAAEAGVAKSTLSGILNGLEARKLVRRRTNAQERRLIIVNLTPAGGALLGSLFPRFNAEETRVVSRLETKEMRQATEALRAILATIDEIDGPASAGA